MVRVKRRYILFELIFESKDDLVNFEKSINERQIVQSIRDSVHQTFGDYGLAAINQSLILKRFNKSTKIGVLGCYRNCYRILFNSLFLIKDILKIRCTFKTHYLSGTIRGCLKALEKMYKGTLKKTKVTKPIEND